MSTDGAINLVGALMYTGLYIYTKQSIYLYEINRMKVLASQALFSCIFCSLYGEIAVK